MGDTEVMEAMEVMEATVEDTVDMVDMEATEVMEDMEGMALKEVGDMAAEKLCEEKRSDVMALTLFVQIFLMVEINLEV